MKKSSLQKAFHKIDKLNLSITLDQKLEINQIICDLSNESYNKGSKMTQKIYTR